MSSQILPEQLPEVGAELPRLKPTGAVSAVSSVLYGLLAYGWFLVTLLYMVGFLANLVVPRSIDQPPGRGLAVAVAINSLLLAAFGIQHSVMARPAFKRWWTTIIPPHLERSTFVLVTNILFAGMFLAWQPMPDLVWEVSGVAGGILWGLFAFGLVLAVLSTFLIDHFELFGVRQVLAATQGKSTPPPTFHVTGVYRYVRHPLMLGFLIAFWAAPTMSHGRLLFATVVTIYVLIALRLEERDLRGFHGEAYAAYQQQVPMLIPRPGRVWNPSEAP